MDSLQAKNTRQLRALLEDRALDKTGRKSQLIDRLLEHEKESRAPSTTSASSASAVAVSTAGGGTSASADTTVMTAVLEQLQSIRERQELMESRLNNSDPTPALSDQLNITSAAPPAVGSRMLPSLPQRLSDRILRGEFIDLEDLLSDNLCLNKTPLQLVAGVDGSGKPHHLSLQLADKSARRTIRDNTPWFEAWTTYMAVIVSAAPTRAREWWATNISFSRPISNFHTNAVLCYNRAFRNSVAGTSSQWDQINQSLWSINLIRAPRPACPLCNVQHGYDRCPHRQQLTSTQQAFQAAAGNARHICINYSHGRPCQFQPCERLHTCSSCGDKGHPASSCPEVGRFKWRKSATSNNKDKSPDKQ